MTTTSGLALDVHDFRAIAEKLEQLVPLAATVKELTVAGHRLEIEWRDDPRDAGRHVVTAIEHVGTGR